MLQPTQGFESNPEDSQAPHQAKKCPAPDATQCSESERCVGAGNEKKDRRVIEQAEEPFDFGSR